jgi:phosphoglycolate phosphatase-like HAD superfamily hydrolase
LGAGKKPAPDLLVGAMKRMGVENGFYIGNSIDDVQAAIAASLTPLAVLTTLDAKCLQEAGASTLLLTPDDIFQAMKV